MKFLLIASVVLNIVILGTVGYFYWQNAPGPVPRAPGKHGRFAVLVKELSLSPAQAQRMKAKWRVFHGGIVKDKQRMFQQRMELLGLMRADNPDLQAIDRNIEDIGDTQEGIEKLVAAHILEVKALLNKDQQKKFFDLIDKFMTRKEDQHAPGVHH